jgi:hypothetical protein
MSKEELKEIILSALIKLNEDGEVEEIWKPNAK